MSEESKIACNRTPFLSDETCYRGDVDIEAFVDFPICRLIDPTIPESATPQLDFPVIPFSPPPCSCVNINVQARKLELSSTDEFSLLVDFRSVGDCCEGNYDADIDLTIPCLPFELKETGKENNVAVTEICEGDLGGTLKLNPKKNPDCEIQFDPTLEIRVPKPTEINFELGLNIETVDCREEPSGECTVESEKEGCIQNITGEISLKLPKTPKIEVCEAELNLNGYSGVEGSFNGISGSDCEATICPVINLTIPCPLEDIEIVIPASVTWGSNKTGQFIIAGEDCTLGGSGDLDLQIPCPLPSGEQVIKGSVSWGSETPTASATIASSSECGITFYEGGSLDLQIPCPIASGTAQVVIEINQCSSTYTGIATIAEGSDCGLSLSQGTASINLPNPLSDLSITGSGDIKVEETSYGCGKSYKISLKSGSGHTGTITAITSVSFDSSSCSISTSTTTWTIDFDNKKVTASSARSKDPDASKLLAREILVSTVQAIRNDPGILSIVDDPNSEEAQKSLDKLGLSTGLTRDDDI